MAVAVKNTPETSAPKLSDHLVVSSLLGALYVVGSIWVVLYGFPLLWQGLFPTTASGTAVLFLVDVALGFGLFALGTRLVGPQPRTGLRAGVFFCLAGLVLVLALTAGISQLLYPLAGGNATLAGVISAVTGVVLLVALGRLLTRPATEKFFLQVEDQGWFSTGSYKRSQGQRVRRGTMLGLLVLAGSGVFTLITHETLNAGPRDWALWLPGVGTVTVLPNVRFALPLLLAGASLWLSYRLVNYPVFADFLIATEAELNKVSWTTRKNLIRDTIVVLVTVVVLTVFLFAVDQIWAQVLTKIGVIRFDTSTPTAGAGPDEQLPY